jgi:hypothetical protein
MKNSAGCSSGGGPYSPRQFPLGEKNTGSAWSVRPSPDRCTPSRAAIFRGVPPLRRNQRHLPLRVRRLPSGRRTAVPNQSQASTGVPPPGARLPVRTTPALAMLGVLQRPIDDLAANLLARMENVSLKSAVSKEQLIKRSLSTNTNYTVDH